VDSNLYGEKHTSLAYTSLALDAYGKVHISYYDAVNRDLKYAYIDNDEDCILSQQDNCPDNYNLLQEDIDEDDVGDACDICQDDRYNDEDADSICGNLDNCPNTSNPLQEDTYPPQGNGIGDACECEGNFDGDLDCDGTDAATFKIDFGRSTILHSCIAGDPCNGDFSCDGDVDGTDASLFKSDFGRGQFQNSCPACVGGIEWCQY
jgi:hypothetical protein